MNEIEAIFEELTGFEVLPDKHDGDFIIQNRHGKLATVIFYSDSYKMMTVSFNIGKGKYAATMSYCFDLHSMNWIDKFQKNWKEEWKDKKTISRCSSEAEQ